MDDATVLITGAGGFVGGRLAELLHARGSDVRAGVRRWSSAARLARMPLAITRCDIMEPAALRERIDGVDVVVHCAYNDRREVIVGGTANVLAAAAEAGVRQVIYLSSAEVYGAATGRLDETDDGVAPFSPYAAAKREAEALCADYHARGLPVTVLRPSIVHGPFSARSVKFAERLLSGDWATFEGHGEGWCNLIYIDDVASAVMATLVNPAAYGETFNLNGPEPITWNEYFRRYNAALGGAPLPVVGRQQAAARAMVRDRVHALTRSARALADDQLMALYQRGGTAARLMKRVKRALFTAPTARELGTLYNRDAIYDASKITRVIGFEPQVGVDHGLELCAAWMAHQGYLPHRGTARDVACREDA